MPLVVKFADAKRPEMGGGGFMGAGGPMGGPRGSGWSPHAGQGAFGSGIMGPVRAFVHPASMCKRYPNTGPVAIQTCQMDLGSVQSEGPVRHELCSMLRLLQATPLGNANVGLCAI